MRHRHKLHTARREDLLHLRRREVTMSLTSSRRREGRPEPPDDKKRHEPQEHFPSIDRHTAAIDARDLQSDPSRE
jgi:hypothetical protein